MTTKHTPAPWSVDGFDVLNGYFHIAKVTVHSHETSKANTKLIAAAPDLLEALTDVLDAFERYSAGYSKGYELNTIICEQAKNAIAKATQ
jgi:hypothetical protein